MKSNAMKFTSIHANRQGHDEGTGIELADEVCTKKRNNVCRVIKNSRYRKDEDRRGSYGMLDLSRSRSG